MALADRDYTKEPLSGEEIRPEKPQILVNDLEDWKLTYGGDDIKFERDEPVTLGWIDVIFWLVLLLLARHSVG
jgi:hypothetical protein